MEPLCARCGAAMVITQLGGTNAYGCPRCRAVFLSHEHAARVRSGVDRWGAQLAEQAATGVPRIDPMRDTAPLFCPLCRARMIPEWVASAAVRLDACNTHGVFFDAHEVAAVLPPEKRQPFIQSTPGHEPIGSVGLGILFDIFAD